MAVMAPFTRRRALGVLGSAGVAAVAAACGNSTPTSPSGASASSTTTSSSGGTNSSTCVISPTETIGPYPDITGMLNGQAFYRRDVTEGRAGTPLTLNLKVVNSGASCAPVANAAVEIWQCDAAGYYSEYSQPGYNGVGQTYLRGLKITDAAGTVTFNTIYPGWYSGRATHIHVDVYINKQRVKVTQIAFPEDVSAQVYASGVYASKGQNTTRNATDNVFSDGVADELATVTGSVATGLTASLTIGIAA
jgi:protocatechuate 3,4-dioxygenase beta subunit